MNQPYKALAGGQQCQIIKNIITFLTQYPAGWDYAPISARYFTMYKVSDTITETPVLFKPT